ncbi:MAG TPA: NBR1-Ig-like domain-containing protein [Anaerolineales bacterium]|nr:NBR1-Ig-like domain-containing protein [Anaerolineales bacterium]
MFAKRASLILFFAGALLLLTACNFPGSTNQPTISPDLIYTAAAQTLTAQQTQAAQGTPIVIPSSTVPATTATSPVVIVPTNTPLPPTNTPLPTNTPIPPTPTATPIPCDRGQFVKDITIPDSTEIAAGTTFVKTWQIKNNGSCTWTSGYALVFYNGDAMSGPASAPITTGTVPPGSTIDISATMIAPTTPGTYKGNWRLRNAAGAVFGIGADADQSFWVQIKSVVPTPTPSPTPAFNVSFDFIAKGPDAAWRNHTTQLPWGDPNDDSAGVAVNVANVKMEDGNTYASLLATYPQMITNGAIVGKYPAYTVQTNDHLRTKVGLRSDCTTQEVKFQIRYIEGGSEVVVGEWLEKCDGALTSLDINLANLVGHSVQFELVVINNGPAVVGRSLWISPRIER